MSQTVVSEGNTPFWHPNLQVPREFPELISDHAYLRELFHGAVEALAPSDWQLLYKVLRSAAKTFIVKNGMEINGQVEAFNVGLQMGKAMRKALWGEY